MKITIIAGARPNFMKIAPLARAIKSASEAGKEISYRLVYTGSKNDTSIEPSLFSDLNLTPPDSYLEVESDNFFKRTADIIVAFADELDKHPANAVIVVDDFTPTMACSLVAKKKGIKVVHLVAGIRSFDMNKPKEVNRMIIDGLSDILFTAGMDANRNLSNTGTDINNIYFVGNILIDTLRLSLPNITRPVNFDILGIKENDYVLLTLNKRDIINNDEKLKEIINTIINSSSKKIVAPLHSYVKSKIESLGLKSDRLLIIQPQSYLSFIYAAKNASAIVTDSGNIAEEATFMNVPCITLDNYTEHNETVTSGTNLLIGEDYSRIKESMEKIEKGEWKSCTLPERWDGRTAERIVQTLLEEI